MQEAVHVMEKFCNVTIIAWRGGTALPHETGGRADKFGNRYESLWVVNQLLRLLKEEIASVTVEPIGEEEEGVDLVIKNLDGTREYHQCKSRNGSKEYWDISDLRKTLEKMKKKLGSDKCNTYYFVSPIYSMILHDLTIRARNSSGSPEDYFKHQITNNKNGQKIRQAYRNFMRYLGLDVESIYGRSLAYDYLRRLFMIRYPDDIQTKRSLLETIRILYIGNDEAIYSLLADFAIENDMLGKEITAITLNNYLLKQKDILIRDLHKDERIVPKIDYLNEEFMESFVPIHDSMIHRTESDACFNEIVNGNSVIIHGKAGSGKSGCVVNLLNRLKENGIACLALRLDRKVPEHTSEQYGRDIGLPASPIHCLDAIAKNKEAVLILDQLDAIRWTNQHSKTALNVCKQMIWEAQNLNQSRVRKIAMVLVCRTFDFQNDNGIKSLFSKSNEKYRFITWKETEVGEMKEEDVKTIVGDNYNSLPEKLKVLLKTPGNLYIWSKLEENQRSKTYITSSDLIKQWWEQLQCNCEEKSISNNEMSKLKETIIFHIDKTGKLMFPLQLLDSCSRSARELLLSHGLLISDRRNIGFVHQSFYDYFSAEKMFHKVYEGASVIDIIGSKSQQTPAKRYQLQMLLEMLLDSDTEKFVELGRELLQHEETRFYMKYVFLEVMGQTQTIDRHMERFIDEYLNNDYWKPHLLEAVFVGHPVFIKLLINKGRIQAWLHSEQNREMAFLMLKSVNKAIPDEIVDLLYPLAFQNDELDVRIYNCLCWNIRDDSDKMFSFRLELLKQRPQLWNLLYFLDEILKSNPDRTIQLLNSLVRNEFIDERSHDYDKKTVYLFIDAAKKNPFLIWETFMPFLAEVTYNADNRYNPRLKVWHCSQFHHTTVHRIYINMIKAAAESIIQESPQLFLEKSKPYLNNKSLAVIEILLYAMEKLPPSHSDFVIHWLLEDPHKRFFDYLGEHDGYLYSVKQVIEKHSRTCSNEVFKNLENEIYYFHEEDEIELARYRFKTGKEIRQEKKGYINETPYWGKIQYYLLPALDSIRLSQKSKNLIQVLNRRFQKYGIPYTRAKARSGWGGSTIGSKAEKISDKQWLKIIENRNYYCRGKRWRNDFLESSPEQFSGDLERVGKKDPNRFAKLALQFSDQVDNHYISAIYRINAETEYPNKENSISNWKPVEMEIAQRVFLKFKDRTDLNVAIAFCRALERRANENWNDEILKMVSDLAEHHIDPEVGKLNVRLSKDEEGKTVETLHANSINCVRGCAAEAIAALLWEDPSRYDKLKATVEAVVNDDHLAVNMAAIECIRPIMNFDREAAVKWFFQLARKDIRIVAHPYAYPLFYEIFKTNERLIKQIAFQMYTSEFEDVSTIGARHVANMNILYGSFEAIVYYDSKKTSPQKKGILAIATNLFRNRRFHEKCKKIIDSYLHDEDIPDHYFSKVFREGALNVEEDLSFIIKLISTKANKYTIHSFVDFIQHNDIPVEAVKDIVLGLCKNLVERVSRGEKSDLYFISSELSRLITILYDRTQENFEANQQCLDMWDTMFENRIGATRELSRSIIDL